MKQIIYLTKKVQTIVVISLLITLAMAIGVKKSMADRLSRKSYNFVLVHGAWQGAWSWYKLKTLLEHEGHTVTTVELLSHGINKEPPETVTLEGYTQQVIDVLDSINEPVVLVGHSMAGIVISAAADARPDSIDKLVYIAAYLLPSGSSIFDLAVLDTESLAGKNLIPIDLDNDGAPDLMDINRDVVVDALLGESNRLDITLSKGLLVPSPFLPFVQPLILDQGGYDSVRRFYISTLKDRAVTPWMQKYMYTNMPVETVYFLKTDHSPFFSNPKKLKKILIHIAAN